MSHLNSNIQNLISNNIKLINNIKNIIELNSIEYKHPNFNNNQRTFDEQDLTQSSNLVYMTVSTKPNLLSYVWEESIKHFKYNYLIMGSTSSNPQPIHTNKNTFLKLFWYWRFKKYIEGIKKIINKKGKSIIVMITDSDDVNVICPPQELLNKYNTSFKSKGYKIVISGQIYCCNYNFLTKNKINGNKQTDYIINLLKNRKNRPDSNISPYKYVNGGTYMGEAGALLTMYEQCLTLKDMFGYNFFDNDSIDDEEVLNMWYSTDNIFNENTKATIDYQQEIFCVIMEFVHNLYLKKKLTDSDKTDLTQLTVNSSGNIINQFNQQPLVFHYAAYNLFCLHAIRLFIIKNAKKLKWLYTINNKNIKNFLKKIAQCGKKGNLLFELFKSECNKNTGCIYNKYAPIYEKCTLKINPKPTDLLLFKNGSCEYNNV